MVSQYYEAHVAPEFAIRGNSVVFKCSIPSFVADFVSVISWQSDASDDFYPSELYGTLKAQLKTQMIITIQPTHTKQTKHHSIKFVLKIIVFNPKVTSTVQTQLEDLNTSKSINQRFSFIIFTLLIFFSLISSFPLFSLH